MQVAWQRLLGSGSAGDGAVLEDSGAGRASVVAAVLTSRRVLLASATLRVLAAAALPPGAPAATSLLWVGPALLFSTEAHQARREPRAAPCQRPCRGTAPERGAWLHILVQHRQCNDTAIADDQLLHQYIEPDVTQWLTLAWARQGVAWPSETEEHERASAFTLGAGGRAQAAPRAQVKQLAWDGSVTLVACLGGGPPAALAGAFGDRLLVARGGAAAGGHAEVSARAATLLPLLLRGWASLATSGILPGAPWLRWAWRLRGAGRRGLRRRLGPHAFSAARSTRAPDADCHLVCSLHSWDTLPHIGGPWRARTTGRWRACREAGRLVRAFDGSGTDAALLRTLCASGAPQAALALAAADSATQVPRLSLGLALGSAGACPGLC